jgi:hypothetical protein
MGHGALRITYSFSPSPHFPHSLFPKIISYGKIRTYADVAELADALDLGSSSERSEGSSPFIRIFNLIAENCISLLAHAKSLLKTVTETAAGRCLDWATPTHLFENQATAR